MKSNVCKLYYVVTKTYLNHIVLEIFKKLTLNNL